MSTYKVAELEGALLDAAVAKAEGLRYRINGECFANPGTPADEPQDLMCTYTPSSYWEDGGPIIEQERIEINASERESGWYANVAQTVIGAWGESPLIAAMRAFVASKFGAEVTLP